MSSPPKTVSGKTLIGAVLGALAFVLGVVFWIGATSSSQHVPGAKPGVGFGDPNATATVSGAASAAPVWDGGAIEKTLHDRRTRDELRQRILQGWAQGEGDVAAAARAGKFVPAPEGDGGGMDPKYIQEVVRGEFFDMAKQCYGDYLSRKPDASGMSTVSMKFQIVADEKHGGIIEDLDVAQDGGLDEEMQTCMHESFMTISFRPPAHGGTVTVEYPISFSPDEPDE